MFNIRLYFVLFSILSLFSYIQAKELESNKDYTATILNKSNILEIDGYRYLFPNLQTQIKRNANILDGNKVKFHLGDIIDDNNIFIEHKVTKFLFGDNKEDGVDLELVDIKHKGHHKKLAHHHMHKHDIGMYGRHKKGKNYHPKHKHAHHHRKIKDNRKAKHRKVGMSSGDIYHSIRPWVNLTYSTTKQKDIQDIGDSSSTNKVFAIGIENDLDIDALIGLAFIHSWNDYDDGSKSYENSISIYGKGFLSDNFFLESDISYAKGSEEHSGETKIELSNNGFECSIGAGYELKMSEHGFITPILSLIKSNHIVSEKEIDNIKYGNVVNDAVSANCKLHFIYNIVRENVSIMPKFAIGGSLMLHQITSDPVNQIADKHIITNAVLDLPDKILEVNIGSEIKSDIYHFDFDIHAYAGENYRDYGGSLKFAVSF